MSDVNDEKEHILFQFKKCRGLRGSGKGNHLVIIVKVEFNAGVLGESGKLEVDLDGEYTELNFSCQLNVPIEDHLIFDEIAQKPVVVTFIEILPKDKKAKEEKTNVIGQCCIDLLPVLKGDKTFQVTETIHVTSSPTLLDGGSASPAEVELNVSTPKPLFTDERLDTSNLLTFCLDSLFSPPEAWNANGSNYIYSAAMPMPTENEDKETQLLIPKGAFRPVGEEEISKQRKWSCVPGASGTCLYMNKSEVPATSYDDEDGELKDPEDVPFRHDAENMKSKITWNSETRCFMFDRAIESLQQMIAQYRYWPLEILRIALGNVKTKGKEEEPLITYHGIVYVDLAPLLYPGVDKIRGAYLVHPYNESELEEKMSRKSCLDEGVIKKIVGSNISLNNMGKEKPVAGGKSTRNEPARVKPSVNTIKTAGEVPAGESEKSPEQPSESQEYLEARTYVMLEIKLQKPLVEKRKPEEITARVAELIPPRPPFQKKQCGSKKAVQDFEKQIFNSAELLLEEFRTMFGADLNKDNDDAHERRKLFLYELNQSGKYFAIKEQLKYYVIKVVREKFMYTSKFETQEDLQDFISILYQFLIDKMHVGLNKYLSTEEKTEVPPQVSDSAMLLHFAKEAEAMFKYDLARTYYQERIVRYKSDAECWLDYGIFNLHLDDVQKAEECFKEVVSLDQQHLYGILLTGLMRLQHEEYVVAEELLDAVSNLHPNEVVPWTLLGLHYSGVENSIMAERSFNVASKLLAAQMKDEKAVHESSIDVINEEDEQMETSHEEIAEVTGNEEEIPPEKEIEVQVEHPSIFLVTAKFLLDCHVTGIAERALAHELVAKVRGPKVLYLELLAQLKMNQKDYESALQNLEEALVLQHANPGVWALKGHLFFEKKDYTSAKQSYERCLAYCDDAPNIHAIYLRLATIYLEIDNQYEAAKITFLKLCKSSPSCVTWLGTGVACYRLDSLNDAEIALNEANILDNKNSEVWAYLSLVCLRQERHLEAEQCYKYAIRLGLDKEPLKEEMKKIMKITDFDTSVL